MTSVASLLPFLLPLPAAVLHDRGTSPIEELSVPGGTLFIAHPDLATAAAVERALAILVGRPARDWRLTHDARGAPALYPEGATTCSVTSTSAPGVRALLFGTGSIGIDAETLPRIALNAAPTDDWLAAEERALLAGLSPSDAVVELACRWVLREASGKALGRGLDLPLDRLAFTVRDGRLVLPGTDDAWRFSLHRRADLILGIAAGPWRATGSALTPATRSLPSAGTRPRRLSTASASSAPAPPRV